MSKIILIGEHAVSLPEMPTDRRDILFYKQKRVDQFWDRSKLLGEYRQIW
jgi:hypothetical protein